MFLSRYKKNNIYPYKPQFYYIKVGLRGSILYGYVFVMMKMAAVTNQIGSAVYCASQNGLNPFTPEFLEWTLLSLNLDISSVANLAVRTKLETE